MNCNFLVKFLTHVALQKSSKHHKFFAKSKFAESRTDTCFVFFSDSLWSRLFLSSCPQNGTYIPDFWEILEESRTTCTTNLFHSLPRGPKYMSTLSTILNFIQKQIKLATVHEYSWAVKTPSGIRCRWRSNFYTPIEFFHTLH